MASNAPAAEEGSRERQAVEYAATFIAHEDEELEEEWPTGGETPRNEYRAAEIPGKIGRHLIENHPKVMHLSRVRIAFIYRNKKDWQKAGKLTFGECKPQSGLNRYFADCDIVVLVNYRVWQLLNPWQRTALIYHELRHADVDEDGKIITRPHDFEVFADELELFGIRTYEDWMKLGRAVQESNDVSTQYDLPLLTVSSGSATEGE